MGGEVPSSFYALLTIRWPKHGMVGSRSGRHGVFVFCHCQISLIITVGVYCGAVDLVDYATMGEGVNNNHNHNNHNNHNHNNNNNNNNQFMALLILLMVPQW